MRLVIAYLISDKDFLSVGKKSILCIDKLLSPIQSFLTDQGARRARHFLPSRLPHRSPPPPWNSDTTTELAPYQCYHIHLTIPCESHCFFFLLICWFSCWLKIFSIFLKKKTFQFFSKMRFISEKFQNSDWSALSLCYLKFTNFGKLNFLENIIILHHQYINNLVIRVFWNSNQDFQFQKVDFIFESWNFCWMLRLFINSGKW